MVTASGEQEKVRRSRPARTTSSPSRSTRPSCWRGCARCCASSATTTRSRRRPPSWRRGTAQLEQRVEEQVDAARAGRPAEAVPVAAARRADRLVGRRAFLESHRREITVVFCDLRGFTRVRRDGRAGGRDGRARRVPRGARRAGPPLRGHARALRRRRADGFFNDPLPCPDRRSGPCGWRWRCASRVAELAEDWRAAATTWGSASASRRATRRSAASASRAASTTRAIGSVTNLAARLCERAPRRQILISQRV